MILTRSPRMWQHFWTWLRGLIAAPLMWNTTFACVIGARLFRNMSTLVLAFVLGTVMPNAKCKIGPHTSQTAACALCATNLWRLYSIVRAAKRLNIAGQSVARLIGQNTSKIVHKELFCFYVRVFGLVCTAPVAGSDSSCEQSILVAAVRPLICTASCVLSWRNLTASAAPACAVFN